MSGQLSNLLKFDRFIILLISIFTILRYQGIIAPYVPSEFYLENLKLDYDIYYNNQFETFVYDLVNFNYINDYFYICFFISVSAIGYIFTYKVLKKYSLLSNEYIYLTLLVLSGLDGFIMYDVKSSLSTFNQSPSTMLSWSLFPVTLYFLLERRVYLLSIVIILNILISIKFGLFPSILALLYNLFNEKKLKEKIFLFFPILISIFFYFIFKSNIVTESIYNDPEIIKKILYQTGDLRDFLILEQRYLHLILLLSSFIIFFKNKNSINRLSKIFNVIFFLTIIMIIFHIVYFKLIFKFYPDIRIFMLSAVANLAFYQYALIVLILHIIFNLKCKNYIKILFIFSLIYWNGEEHLWISKKISLSFLLLAIIFYFLEKKKAVKFDLNNSMICLMIIFFYFPILLANYFRFTSTLSYNLIKEGSPKVFSNIAGIPFLEKYVLEISKCKNIPMLFFYRGSKFVNSQHHYLSLGKYPKKKSNIYYPSFSANILSKKSFFYESNGRLFQKKTEFDEHFKRAEVFKIISFALNNNNLDLDIIKKKIDFPFLIIVSDNVEEKTIQIYPVNSELIPESDKTCYLFQ